MAVRRCGRDLRVDSHERPSERPVPLLAEPGQACILWMCISCAQPPIEARSKSILVVKARSEAEKSVSVLLVLDDDHEYNQHVVERLEGLAGVAVDGLYRPKSTVSIKLWLAFPWLMG